jgi:hypothetical protein
LETTALPSSFPRKRESTGRPLDSRFRGNDEFVRLFQRKNAQRVTVPNVAPRSNWFCRKNATSSTGAR